MTNPTPLRRMSPRARAGYRIRGQRLLRRGRDMAAIRWPAMERDMHIIERKSLTLPRPFRIPGKCAPRSPNYIARWRLQRARNSSLTNLNLAKFPRARRR